MADALTLGAAYSSVQGWARPLPMERARPPHYWPRSSLIPSCSVAFALPHPKHLRTPSDSPAVLAHNTPRNTFTEVPRRDDSQLMNDAISSTETISYYAPGETPRGPFGAGDFYLTSSGRIGSRMIQRWQTRRYKDGESAYAKWNHAGLFLGDAGLIAEALGNGVVRRDISAYTEPRVAVIRPPDMAELDRGQIRRFADEVLRVRFEYSYETLLAIALQLTPRTPWVRRTTRPNARPSCAGAYGIRTPWPTLSWTR
jgi:hypothetical protein